MRHARVVHTVALLLAVTPAPAATSAAESSRARAVHASLERAVSNGCTYDLKLDGALHGRDRNVQPDLTVAARVICPNGTQVEVRDRVLSREGMSRASLDRAIERAARVVERNGPDRCVYAPELSLRHDRLEAGAVVVACTTRLDRRSSD